LKDLMFQAELDTMSSAASSSKQWRVANS
jgi:hypothetical protein